MKLLKKLTTVAVMAAVCCTLNLPVAAEAMTYKANPELEKCPPHILKRQNEEYKEYEPTTHEFVYAYVENRDGTFTAVKATCTVTGYYENYDLVCTKCPLYQLQMGPGDVIKHSSCKSK